MDRRSNRASQRRADNAAAATAALLHARMLCCEILLRDLRHEICACANSTWVHGVWDSLLRSEDNIGLMVYIKE